MKKFDAAYFLDSDKVIEEYLKVKFEQGEDAVNKAKDTVIRAKAINCIVEDSGAVRESVCDIISKDVWNMEDRETVLELFASHRK